jgi:predicted amidophosphoribosyltransferase
MECLAFLIVLVVFTLWMKSTTLECPSCRSRIHKRATVCPHCTRQVVRPLDREQRPTWRQLAIIILVIAAISILAHLLT